MVTNRISTPIPIIKMNNTKKAMKIEDTAKPGATKGLVINTVSMRTITNLKAINIKRKELLRPPD